jgi:hypothetical protein
MRFLRALHLNIFEQAPNIMFFNNLLIPVAIISQQSKTDLISFAILRLSSQEQIEYISVAMSAACFTYSCNFRGEIV